MHQQHHFQIDTAVAIRIPAAEGSLEGVLTVPSQAGGLVVFAHGSGSSHLSPRNRFVAQKLTEHRLATFLFDLLTEEEERRDMFTGELRFDIPFLSDRLVFATQWLLERYDLAPMAIGLFGASTGAAAALSASTRLRAAAVVSRGGRPDLAGHALEKVEAPTLLIVGGDDPLVLGLNREAMAKMAGPVELQLLPGAGHLFEEPGALEQVAEYAAAWFSRFLKSNA